MNVDQQVGIGEMAIYGAGDFVAYLLMHGYLSGDARANTRRNVILGSHCRLRHWPTRLYGKAGLRDLPIGVISMIPCIGGYRRGSQQCDDLHR